MDAAWSEYSPARARTIEVEAALHHALKRPSIDRTRARALELRDGFRRGVADATVAEISRLAEELNAAQLELEARRAELVALDAEEPARGASVEKKLARRRHLRELEEEIEGVAAMIEPARAALSAAQGEAAGTVLSAALKAKALLAAERARLRAEWQKRDAELGAEWLVVVGILNALELRPVEVLTSQDALWYLN
jgi:multidrug resistance efflux pump